MKIAKQMWTYSSHFCYTTTSGSFLSVVSTIDITDGNWVNISKTDNFRKDYGITVGVFKFKTI